MKMKGLNAVLALSVVVLLVVVVCRFVSGGSGEGREKDRAAEKSSRIREFAGKASARKASAAAEKAKPGKIRRVKAGSVNADWTVDDFDDPDHPYTPEDKKVALELQVSLDALDDIDEEVFRKLDQAVALGRRLTPTETKAQKARARFQAAASKAAKSSNPAVRRECVDAYNWRGGESLEDLTPMMADPDAEVSEAAIDAVEQALDEQENPNLRFEAAAAYISTFSTNEDALDMLSGTMVSAALEIVDADDDSAAAEQRARENRVLVVDTLSSIIDAGYGKSVETAKEAFNDITSEDWISLEEAHRWAQDPDNYEAPEF